MLKNMVAVEHLWDAKCMAFCCRPAGLIDAVQALQHRNQLLQRDLDRWRGRHDEQQVRCCFAHWLLPRLIF